MDKSPQCGWMATTVALGAPVRERRRYRQTTRCCLALLTCIALSGCTSFGEYVHNGFKVGPNYIRPAAQTEAEWIDSSDVRVKSDPPADCAWWAVLNDPTLNGLIGSAYRQNLDLRAAGARITEARAQRAIAIGTLFPQTQTMNLASLQSQFSQNLPIPLPVNFDILAAGFNGSWELDFWGRYRRAVEAANANLSVSVEQYGEVLVLLLSDVAVNYIELRTYQQRLAYAQKNVEIQRGSLKLAEARFKQGASSELDLRQARAILWQTESLVPVFEAGARQSSNALCVLLGMSPVDLASALGPAPIPTAPPTVALGVPADLLARRPDIRRAERQVAEQSARIGIATAELYPSLSINGYVGFWSQHSRELFNGDSFTGAFLPQFSWNVLNYGRIANNIAAQDARLQSVALNYQQTVLRAGREVEDALTRFLHAQLQAKYLDRSVVDSARAVELVKLQFEGGTTDFNRVYTLQASLTSQQDQLASAQGAIALNLVAVYKALGGGWRCFQRCNGMPAPCYPTGAESPPAPAPELLPTPPEVPPTAQRNVNVAQHVAPQAGPKSPQPVVAAVGAMPTTVPANVPHSLPSMPAPGSAPAALPMSQQLVTQPPPPPPQPAMPAALPPNSAARPLPAPASPSAPPKKKPQPTVVPVNHYAPIQAAR